MEALIGVQTCIYTELPATKNFLQVTSPDLVLGDARRLRIDYNKPSIVNRGGRPRLAGGAEAAVRNLAGLRRPLQWPRDRRRGGRRCWRLEPQHTTE